MCLYPVLMARMPDGTILPAKYGDVDVFPVKCGKCIECCIDYSREWSFRCCLEAELYEKSIIVTFTYDDKHLPPDLNLRYSDFQLFLKRIRKKYNLRFLVTGEYGAKTKRPHFHAILFGYCPDDLQFYKQSPAGGDLFVSKELENFWQNGFCPFEMFSQRGAFYAVKYMQKWLVENDKSLSNRVQPFTRMSLKPGIGVANLRWLKGFSTDKIYSCGKYIKLPRYFLTIAERFGYDVESIKNKRIAISKLVNVDLVKKRKLSKKYFRKVVKKY